MTSRANHSPQRLGFASKSVVGMKSFYRNLTTDGNEMGRVAFGKVDECLSYIHNVFFYDLETAMANVIEALTTFEEICKWFSAHGASVMLSFANVDCFEAAMKWLASQKPEDFYNRCQEYIEHVFPHVDSDSSSASPIIHKNARLKERCIAHQRYYKTSYTNIVMSPS